MHKIINPTIFVDSANEIKSITEAIAIAETKIFKTAFFFPNQKIEKKIENRLKAALAKIGIFEIKKINLNELKNLSYQRINSLINLKLLIAFDEHGQWIKNAYQLMKFRKN